MDSPMRRVGVFYQPQIPATMVLAQEIAQWLHHHDMGSWIHSAWESGTHIEEISRCDLLMALGGDGTVLRAARAAIEAQMTHGQAPLLLTVDFGRLGFLAEIQPNEAVALLPRVIGQDFWVEERCLLRAEQRRGYEVVTKAFALNDVVLARGDGPHVLRLTLMMDGAEVARYVADGLIVATPTGSTAYAYAAGGPIMAPNLDALLVIPIAPHLALARSIVAPSDTLVEVQAESHYPALVAVDGQQMFPWINGDRLQVTSSQQSVRFVRLGRPDSFYKTLHARLSKPRVG